MLTIDASIASVDPRADEVQREAPEGPDVTAFFPTASQMAIALTDQRLFVWSLGFSGKPKQFLGSVPLAAVAAARGGEGSFGTSLRVTMRSGAMIDLEFLKGEPAADFTAQLVAQVERPSTPAP